MGLESTGMSVESAGMRGESAGIIPFLQEWNWNPQEWDIFNKVSYFWSTPYLIIIYLLNCLYLLHLYIIYYIYLRITFNGYINKT